MSYNAEGLTAGNIVHSAASLSAGTTAGTIQHTAAVSYTNNGVFASKAATNNIPIPAPSPTGANGIRTALAIGEKCAFTMGIGAGGVYSFTQGPVVAAGEPAPVAPPNGNVAVMGVFVVTAASAVYTPGTTALTGITTFYNTSTLPGSALN